MPVAFSNNWKNYKKTMDEIERLQVQLELFPKRTSTKSQIKKLRRELFDNYEGQLNGNNHVNPIVVTETVKSWFETNCRVNTPPEVQRWIESQDWESNGTVKYVADNIVGQNLCQLCFKGGTPYCPQVSGDETQCASGLVKEIVKSSERYVHIPNTEKNFETFMNGSTQYLDKKVREQENFESPIEKIMFEALKPVAKKHGLRLVSEHPMYDEGRLEVRYSLDIVFIDGNTSRPILDVETDGLRYHDGYEAMSNDRARDRWLLIRGIPTMRFTSREIFSDVNSCVEQVNHALTALTRKR